MEFLPWILDFRLLDDFRDAPEGGKGLNPPQNHPQSWELHSWKKWVPFLFDDKTGNRTSTAAYQNTRH